MKRQYCVLILKYLRITLFKRNHMNQLKTFILFLFFTSITFAQSGSVNDTIIASQYFRKADSLLNDRKLDSAIIYFKKALSIYEKAKAWEKVAGCYNELAEGQYEKSDYEESLKNAQNALKINNNYLDENNLEKAYSLDIIARKIELVDLDFNKALDYYKKSLKIKENNINVKSTSLRKSYANLVSIYSNLGEYSLALEYIEKTVAIDTTNIKNLLERSQLSSKLANLYLELGNWDDSLEYLKKLHEVLEKKYDQSNEIYADIYHKIGVLYIEKRDYNQALKYLEKSEKILKSKSAIIPSSFYTSMGNIYNDLGLSEQALTYHHKSLEIARLTFGETSLRVIINYYNIANAYISKEEYDSGLEYLNKTLVLGEKILGKDHVELTRTHQLMATVYRKKKDFIKAESLLDKVLKICRIPLGKNHPRIALLYYQYGDLWSDQNQFDKAISYFNKSIEIRKLVFGEKSAPVSYAYKAIGDNFLLNKEYDKAIDFFNKSIKSNIITNELNHMDIEKTYDSSLFLSSSLGMASTFLKRYYDLGDIDDLKKARIHYKNIDNFIDPMNRKIINTKDKLSYYSELNNFYLDAIKLCLSEFDEEQDLKSVYEAFNYSEKSKSNTLKTLLNSNKAKEYSGISNELITLEKNIRIDKAFYQSNINKQLSNKQIDSTKLSDYESQLFGISRKQDSLTEVLEKNYPNYYELKYQDKVISVAEIQQKLDDKTTLLEFFTGDGITYAFTISKNKMSVRKVPTPKLEEQLNRFHSSITENVKEHKAISYQLYQLLIAPLRDELIGTQLIIVPDGRLWHLNFDLLHTHQDSSNNPKTWPYLLKEYAISYANSATLLFRDPMDKNSEFVSEDLKECLAFSFSGDSNPSD